MKKVKVTNIIKLYTLLLLRNKPIHGYELIKELEACTFQKISASHVYPFLQLLKKNNLIELKKSGKRKKKQYNLTGGGKRFTDKMIDRFSTIINADIQKKVKKCVHCNCKIYEGGHKEKIKGRIKYFCCIHCAKSAK